MMAIKFGEPGTLHAFPGKNLGYMVHEDGSVEQIAFPNAVTTARKRLVYFSTQAFVDRICLGDSCLLCGIAPDEADFNNEHVLPKWVLKRYALFDRAINFGNGTSMQYGRYTLPCCAECNSLLGMALEQRVREFIDAEDPWSGIDADTVWLLFRWLCLIFVKTHLKDKMVPLHRDRRQGDGTLASEHIWEPLHHIHCVARTIYTDAIVQRRVVGSVFVSYVKPEEGVGDFDFVDLSAARAMLLRLGTLGIVAVFDDAGEANGMMHDTISRITGSLSAIQFRELVARYAHANLHLVSRPSFFSSLDDEGRYQITVELPAEPEYAKYDHTAYKLLFMKCCGDAIRAHPESERLLAAVERGTCSFLFDDQNKFIAD